MLPHALSEMGAAPELQARYVGVARSQAAGAPEPTVSAKTLRSVLGAASAAGRDPRALVRACGIDDQGMAANDFRFPHARWVELWHALEAENEGAGMGLRAGATLPLWWDSLDHLLAASATLRDALARFGRYYALVSTAVRHVLREGEKPIVERVYLPGATRSRAATELAFATMVRRFRLLSARDWAPTEVLFSHEPSSPVAAYDRAFGCRVVFEAERDAIVLSRDVLAVPMERASIDTCLLLEPTIAARAERVHDAVIGLVDRARAIVVAELGGGVPSLDTTARRLGLGSRTLQRRLGEEGVPYRVLLEQAREQVARALLDDPKVMPSDVGARVGFSDASAFYKAFRRWTGLTPGAYRRR